MAREERARACAAISALVGGSQGRAHTKAAAAILAPPPGWSLLMDAPASASLPGLRASAFVHHGSEGFVIAIGGADFDFFAGALRDSRSPDDFLINLALDIGLTPFTEPMAQAARLFAQVRRWSQERSEGRAPACDSITFTGHGIGGGIASVMATWFNQPCIAFAQAPLRAVATTPRDFEAARAATEPLLGSSDDAVLALRTFMRAPAQTLAEREKTQVSHWHVQGEVLQALRSPATTIQGIEHPLDAGMRPRAVDDAIALHDMRLHAALLHREPCLTATSLKEGFSGDSFPLLAQWQEEVHRGCVTGNLPDKENACAETAGAMAAE